MSFFKMREIGKSAHFNNKKHWAISDKIDLEASQETPTKSTCSQTCHYNEFYMTLFSYLVICYKCAFVTLL